MRGLILSLRRNQNFNVLRALCTVLQLDLPRQILLVPIPGWKSKNRANPLPELMCRCLERQSLQLLQSCRPTRPKPNQSQAESQQSVQQLRSTACLDTEADASQSNASERGGLTGG